MASVMYQILTTDLRENNFANITTFNTVDYNELKWNVKTIGNSGEIPLVFYSSP